MGRTWSAKEVQYLRERSSTDCYADIAAALGRSTCGVKTTAQRLGITRRRFWTKEEVEYLQQYARKQSAPQIARHLGRTRSSVHQRMKILGLTHPRQPFAADFEEVLRAKHALGWTDSEIARATGHDRHAVSRRRKLLGLAFNGLSQHRRRQVAERTREQLRKAGLNSLAEVRSAAFRKYARDCGWPEDLRPRHVQILNALWTHGPMTRKELSAEIGLPWRGVHKTFYCNEKIPGQPQGSYLSGLVRRGLIIDLGRKVYQGGQGKNVHAYSLPLNIQRGKVV